jgi:glycosyltransferase involved in cell wall biosynthesis
MTEPLPFVSVILPVRNEAGHIAGTLAAVLAQDYPPDRMEVIVVDGQSTDRTREIVQALKAPMALQLLDNPRQIAPTALNIGLRAAKGDILVRVDGHTVIAPDYVRQCVAALQRTGADNAGGTMTAVSANAFGEVVAAATSTPFGVGGGRFHYSQTEEWVDTVYLGAWPRAVFERIGLFDEELVRDQDDEFNYRLREQGGRIFHTPRIKSSYTGRTRPTGLWQQYFQYGLWKVRVLQKHPRQMQLRQFVPPLFVLALLGSLVLAFWTSLGGVLFALIGGAYLAADLGASLWTARRKRTRLIGVLPIVFPMLHLSYGLGFLIGLARFWNRWADRMGQVPAWQPQSDLDRLRAEYADRERRLAEQDRYSVFNPAQLFLIQQRQRAVLALLKRHGLTSLAERRCLEAGCGKGGVLLEYLNYGVKPCQLHGVDVLPVSLQVAQQTLPHLPLINADAQSLPYSSGTFDVVLQYTVFSSILDADLKARLAHELLRVLKPGGLIIWYDFWLNPTNPQTAGIRPAEVRGLFPDCTFEFQRITLAPPIARRLATVSWGGCGLLEKLRVFNTHYLIAITKHSGRSVF